MAENGKKEYVKIAVGDIGTQVFWFNKELKANAQFEYALPVTAGAEFGGDTETFDAPETDLDYVPKIGGRTSLSDISYTINFTKEKYARVEEITNKTIPQIYMEVFQDGSAVVFSGTSGLPSITAGDVRQITMSIAPDFLCFVKDIYRLDKAERTKLDALVADDTYKDDSEEETNYELYTLVEGENDQSEDDDYGVIKLNINTIPAQRVDYYATTEAPSPVIEA